MDFNIDRRILIYASVTGFILILVSLMVLPIGIPVIEHVVSYWWADPGLQYAVGQTHKLIWYKKAGASALFVFGIFFCAWAWLKLQKKAVWAILLWAYLIFCGAAIGSQFLTVGAWQTFAIKNLDPAFENEPSMIHVIDSIDSPQAFIADMPKYSGVNGVAKGPLAPKGPGYVLLFYYLDQVGKKVLSLLGQDNSKLDIRAIALACIFTLLIGLHLIPFYYLVRVVFSEPLARVGLMIMSISPMVSYGFSKWMAWGHHLMILVSSTCLLMVCAGLKQQRWFWPVVSLVLAVVISFINWESLALLGLLIFIIALHVYKTERSALHKLPLAKISGIVIGFIAAFCLVLYFGFDFNIWTYIWNHLIIDHVLFSMRKMFVSKGIFIYMASIFTNVTGFLFFIGIALSVQLIISLNSQWKLGFQKVSIPVVLVLALISFTLLLDLSGMATETGRLWAFLYPGYALLALAEFERIADQRKVILLGLAIFILQGLQVLVIRSVFFSV